jgi:hypothetical protein
MTAKTFATWFSLCLPIACLFAQSPQQPVPDRNSGGASLARFAGAWKGVCADGKEFVVLTLKEGGSGIGGTISLGNFQGQEGQCASVVNPPSDEHAMQVTDAHLQGAVLAFKGASGSQFEMTVAGADGARLKFLGTPVENNPWDLKRAK